MTRITRIYQSLTGYKVSFSIVCLAVIFIGFAGPNLVVAQQQATPLPVNETTTGNGPSTNTSQSQVQSLGQPGSNTQTTSLEPKLDQPFVWRGLITSKIDGLPMPEGDGQTAIILPLRDDNGIYTGTLTYQANAPVDVVVWNHIAPGNLTAVPEDLTDIENIGVIANKTVIPTVVASGESGSVPFLGNALELNSGDETPFVATYAISANAAPPEFISNLTVLENQTAEDEDEEQVE